MSLTFPTSPAGRTPPGLPKRAAHCRCVGGPRVDPGTGWCTSCGKYSRDTIADTFRRRAAKIARNAAKEQRRAA